MYRDKLIRYGLIALLCLPLFNITLAAPYAPSYFSLNPRAVKKALAKEIKNATDASKICGLYTVTKKPELLEKLMHFVSAQDNMVLYFAYEMLNREQVCAAKKITPQECQEKAIEPLLKVFKKQYRQQPERHLDLVHATRIIIEYVKDARSKNGLVDEQWHTIVKANPKLDYWPRIKKLTR